MPKTTHAHGRAIGLLLATALLATACGSSGDATFDPGAGGVQGGETATEPAAADDADDTAADAAGGASEQTTAQDDRHARADPNPLGPRPTAAATPTQETHSQPG